MQWIVPQLSDQEFDIEADLEIINVQSYPAVGGIWKVKFLTNGTADLIITAVNGTTFGTESPDDLDFLQLNNGTHQLNPIFNGTTITYYNYSSTEEGFEESLVLTPFEHHLMFQFGNQTAFAHNSAFVPNGPKVILLYGDPIVLGSPDIEDDLALTSPVIPGWDEAADRKDSIYIHDETGGACNNPSDSCTEIQVTEAGTYRVNYGLSITQGDITSARYQAISYIQNDTDGTGGYNTNEGTSCFDSSYITTDDTVNTAVWSGECLVELEANGKVRVGLSKVSDVTGSGSYTFADNENWFQMQLIENPTISLRKTNTALTIDNALPDPMTFVDADIVTYDTSIFTFDGSSPNAVITVDVSGLYKVSYSAVYEDPSFTSSVIGKIQTRPDDQFVDSVYGGSIAFNRNASGITQSALSSSTILELTPGDEIRFVSIDEGTSTSTATDYHLDVEYLGTSSSANVLTVYNSTGGLDLDSASDVLIDWNSSDEIGSLFTFTGTPSSPTEEITVNAAGVYHIAYGIDSEHTANQNERFAQKTRLQVDSGSGYVDANACYANSFARGFAPEQSPLLSATAAADATITNTSYELMDSMTLTPPAGDYLVIFSTDISGPTVGVNGDFIDAAIFVDGTILQHTERDIENEGSIDGLPYPLATNAKITVDGTETVEVRWKVTAAEGTWTAHERSLILLPADGADILEASATNTPVTGSGTYALLDSMTLTPGRGNYLLVFSTSAFADSNNDAGDFAVFVGGTEVAHTERSIQAEPSIKDVPTPILIGAEVSVQAGQDVEIQWRLSGGSDQVRTHERTLNLVRIDSSNISQVIATGDTSDTNTSYSLLDSMTITPGTGEYLALFSSTQRDGTIGTEQTVFYSLFVGGTQVEAAERMSGYDRTIDNSDMPAMTTGIVTPSNGDTVEIQWYSNISTSRTIHERTFVLLKTDGLDHNTATAAASCMLELEVGDKIRVASLRKSDAMAGTNQNTAGNEIYLTIQALSISNPPLQESLELVDTVEAAVIKDYPESLALVDTVEATKDAVVSFTESLSLLDDPVLVQSAGTTIVSFIESLTLDDVPITNFVGPIKHQESLSFGDIVETVHEVTISLSESLSLDDSTVISNAFVPANSDFKIQHGTFTISDASATGTITSVGGADFDVCTGQCFIM